MCRVDLLLNLGFHSIYNRFLKSIARSDLQQPLEAGMQKTEPGGYYSDC